MEGTLAPSLVFEDLETGYEDEFQILDAQPQFPKLDGVLFPMVLQNAEVIAPCQWMGGAEVTLTVALNNYYQPMTEENADDVIQDVYDFLMSKIEPETHEVVQPNQMTDENIGVDQTQLEADMPAEIVSNMPLIREGTIQESVKASQSETAPSVIPSSPDTDNAHGQKNPPEPASRVKFEREYVDVPLSKTRTVERQPEAPKKQANARQVIERPGERDVALPETQEITNGSHENRPAYQPVERPLDEGYEQPYEGRNSPEQGFSTAETSMEYIPNDILEIDRFKQALGPYEYDVDAGELEEKSLLQDVAPSEVIGAEEPEEPGEFEAPTQEDLPTTDIFDVLEEVMLAVTEDDTESDDVTSTLIQSIADALLYAEKMEAFEADEDATENDIHEELRALYTSQLEPLPERRRADLVDALIRLTLDERMDGIEPDAEEEGEDPDELAFLAGAKKHVRRISVIMRTIQKVLARIKAIGRSALRLHGVSVYGVGAA